MAEGVQKTCKYCDGTVDWQNFNGAWSLRNENGTKHFCPQYLEFRRQEQAKKELEAAENRKAIDKHREQSGYL